MAWTKGKSLDFPLSQIKLASPLSAGIAGQDAVVGQFSIAFGLCGYK
jgi:hypothetical protein